MKANEVKPGTRCGCSAGPNSECHQRSSYCQRDAVRMVTVPGMTRTIAAMLGKEPQGCTYSIPMCEPCAAWHEAR